MKIYGIITLVLLLRIAGYAQHTEKLTIKVAGNCGLCEKRIEKAALKRGVKMAEWEKETGILTVYYKSNKISAQQIITSILEAGHDVEEQQAPDEAYNRLPACCRYREGTQKHE